MDVQYDEQRGNPPAPECLVSWAVREPFYQATRSVLDWNEPADGDANYRTIPIVRLEGPLKVCKVEWPPGARPTFGGILEKTLRNYVGRCFD